jgi:hypothetical protein
MGKASRKKQAAPRRSVPQHPVSGALIELVSPLQEQGMPLEAYRMLINLGVLAWNVAQFPKAERKERMLAFFKDILELSLSFDEIVAVNSAEEVAREPAPDMDTVTLVKSLVSRKDRLFPDDRRFVVEYEVYPKGEEFRVNVVSRLFDRPPSMVKPE